MEESEEKMKGKHEERRERGRKDNVLVEWKERKRGGKYMKGSEEKMKGNEEKERKTIRDNMKIREKKLKE